MARERSLLVRPISDRFEKFVGVVTPEELRVGDSLFNLDASNHRFTSVNRPLSNSDLDPEAEISIRIGLDQIGFDDALEACDLRPQDVRLSVFLRSTVLGQGFLALSETMDNVLDDEVRVDLRNTDSPLECVASAALSPYSIQIALTLDLEIDRAVESLDPSRKHSIFDEAKIDVRFKGEGGLSVDIRALDADLRRQFEIGKDCWVYADTSELTLSDASSIANELTIYIDEKILPTIRDNQGKPLNRLMFSMIFDYVNAQLALLASEEIEKDSLTFADVEEDLLGQICKGWAKQIKVPDLEPTQVFGLVKERPGYLLSLLQQGTTVPKHFKHATYDGIE